MKKERIQRFAHFAIGGLVIGSIVVAGLGQAVLQLWNWLIPSIFGLPRIGFWQALGLMGLSWILFAGPRGMRPRGPWRRMSPEERARFRQGMRERIKPVTT